MDIKCNEMKNRINNIFVHTSEVKDKFQVFDSIRKTMLIGNSESAIINKFLIGDSRVGKTQMLKQYAKTLKPYTKVDPDGTERDIKPIIYMEMPSPFALGEFCRILIERLGGIRLSSRVRIGDMINQIFTLIKNQEVQMLIFDEMDYVINSIGRDKETCMHTIKHISNETQVCVICSGTEDSLTLLDISKQINERFIRMDMNPFQGCNEEFRQFLDKLEKQIQPPEPLYLESPAMAEMFFEMSQGKVGRITTVITEAYRAVGLLEGNIKDISEALIDVDDLLDAYNNLFLKQ